MDIAFRVDASSQIGTGHFMRCLTLAEELHKTGAELRFISRELPAHLAGMLVAKGISHTPLIGEPPAPPAYDLAHSSWLWTEQEYDAQASLCALEGGTWDWLVVDHYALDYRWESRMREAAKRIMVIDDLADRRHDSDVLLDQNYYLNMSERYRGKTSENCRLLLGPRYALLREEFRKQREHLRLRTGEVRRVLVSFGGVDAGNFTGLAVEALARMGLKKMHVDVVIGAQHPHRHEVEQSCAAAGFSSHVQTSRMAELMAAADFAIGAGGVATWERCCLGLPTLAFSLAENQRVQVHDAAVSGLLISANSTDDLRATIKIQVGALRDNSSILRLVSKMASDHVDGNGVLRVLGALGVSSIKIRRASVEDALCLFNWRNHPSVRAVSRNHDVLDWVSHSAWFEQTLEMNGRELLIGELNAQPVGVVRFDIDEEAAEVSIYLVPDSGFSGQGRNLLLSAERWLKTHRPEVRRLAAVVLGENSPSQRLFLGAEYIIQHIHYSKELRD